VTAEPIPAEGEGTRPGSRLTALYPYLLLAACMLMWAGNWVIGRALRETMPPLAMTFWRWTVAALVLAPFALPRLKGKGMLIWRSWPILVALTITGGAFYQAAAYFGLRHTETVNAVLLNAVSPLFILLAAWSFDGERASLRQLWGIVLAVIGVLVILNRGEFSRLLGLRFSIGDLAILAMMPLWAVYTVMLRRRPPEIDNIALIFIVAALGVPLLLPAYLLESAYIQAPPLAWNTVGAALYTGSFASAAAYWCWNRGAELIGPSRAGFTTYLMPVFTTILAVALLGEEVHPFHALGIATILGGVWLSTSAKSRAVARRD
jgi:drug/metabolite transporter (DMT)-like permease